MPQPNSDPLHIRVHCEIIRQNIEQKDLAKKIGRDPSAVTRALQGKSPINLKKIASILKVKAR